MTEKELTVSGPICRKCKKNTCQYYGEHGGYSVQCEACNNKQGVKRRAAAAFKRRRARGIANPNELSMSEIEELMFNPVADCPHCKRPPEVWADSAGFEIICTTERGHVTSGTQKTLNDAVVAWRKVVEKGMK